MDILHQKIAPFDPSTVETVDDALTALQRCSFQGRQLGVAVEVFWNFLNESDCFKVLALAGAMIPAGMGEVVCQMMERGLVDAIVSTGANITHDLVNAFHDGQAHYVGTPLADDDELYRKEVNRIYDTFLPEDAYRVARDHEYEILRAKYGTTSVAVPPSELFAVMGASLDRRGMIQVAARQGVPVFCGATSDSDFGMTVAEKREQGLLHVTLDELADVTNFAQLVQAHEKNANIIVGGGVPRNWTQQIFPYLKQRKVTRPHDEYGYNYSVRFHTALEYDGGLSGCTISESKSWGKYVKDAKHASVWVDATIALPLVVTAIIQRQRQRHQETTKAAAPT